MNKGKWKISSKSIISIRWQNHLPRLIVHEKYEKFVNWFLRILTVFGIVTSVIAFPIWYINLLFAIVLFIIEQFFEKSIFKYTSIYVQPMPDFKYDSKEWKGMAFAFPQDPDQKLLNIVGCAFATEEYAHKFFKLLKAWNYGEVEDKDNNICLSFIVESEKEYSVYLYPNPERKIVDQFFKKAEESLKYEKYGKEHQKLIMHMVFCKIFPYRVNSQLKIFIEKQSLDHPFWLKVFIMKKNGKIEMVHNENAILKYHYKFKNRHELNKNEYEYWHGKNVMKK